MSLVMLDIIKNISCSNPGPLLVVGDGNFSFSKDLALSFKDSTKIFATSLDARELVYENIAARDNTEYLRQLPYVSVQHGIDATNLTKWYAGELFTVIIFNFPHVGGKSNIKKCRLLLRKFFLSAGQHLCPEGKVVVSLCKGQGGTPGDVDRVAYGNTWKVSSQAAAEGFVLTDLRSFDVSQLHNYSQAGYRSKIKNRFFTEGALVHVFTKRARIENVSASISDLDHCGHLESVICGKIDAFLLAHNIVDTSKETVRAVDLAAPINPHTSHVNIHTSYSVPLSFKNAFLEYLVGDLWRKFAVASVAMETPHQSNTYDASLVPSFITDVSLCRHPEVTVSYSEDGNIAYKKVEYESYILQDIERQFVAKGETKNADDLTIGGFCVASVKSTESASVVTLHLNEIILSCCGVDNLNYLLSRDEVFHSHLKEHLKKLNDEEHLSPPIYSLRTLVRYPLCYRHDLCFWLSRGCTERRLLSVVRSCTQPWLHAMCLLRVLNHEETEMICNTFVLLSSMGIS